MSGDNWSRPQFFKYSGYMAMLFMATQNLCVTQNVISWEYGCVGTNRRENDVTGPILCTALRYLVGQRVLRY